VTCGNVHAVRHAALRTAGLAVVLAAVLLGACGDDGGNDGPDLGDGTDTTTTSAAADGSTTTVATTAPPATGGSTVVPTTPPGTDLGSPTLDDASSVSTTGLDRVTFGMTLTQAETAAGTRLLVDPAAAMTTECAVVRPEAGGEGISFTLFKGTVERVDITAPSKVRTRSGAGISTTVAQLQTLYGERLAAPPGSPTTYVFTPVDAADAVYRVVFDTDGTTVTAFRAGRATVTVSAAPCT
jgi:hypothetical protein